MRVAVVDIGLGNLRSVVKAIETAGVERGVSVARSADPDALRRADAIVVPGQGGFGACARGLSGPLAEVILERLRAGTPYLGICLGLQVLFETSAEAPEARGLGWFKGKVERLRGSPGIKIPHMGWNQLALTAPGHPVLEAAGGAGTWVYFVHSFHAVPSDAGLVRASVTHGDNLVTAAVGRDNVLATQFHPEKSQAAGIALLRGFLASI